MGKNKTKTYILLAVVLLVWSLIGYRIYKTVKPSVPKVAIVNTVAAFKPFKVKKKDTFSIKAAYRDPFLGTLKNRHKKVKTHKKVKKVVSKTKKIIFPKIEYKGIISPKSRLDKRFILKINQKTVLYKLLATHQDVQLLQGNEKEIVIYYQGEQKTIQLR